MAFAFAHLQRVTSPLSYRFHAVFRREQVGSKPAYGPVGETYELFND